MLYLVIDNYIEEFRTLKKEEILISIDLFISSTKVYKRASGFF
jgi:hypothetical protein